MSDKLKKMLAHCKPGTVNVAPWLLSLGISRDLQKRYRRGGWLESVGPGAFKRPGDTLDWQGALYALQEQLHLPIHVGALTALGLRGFTHYLRIGAEQVFLFSPPAINLPAWFKNKDWGVPVRHHRTSMLPPKVGLMKHEEKTFAITISAPERAMLECLHLAPEHVELVECHQIMEGLVSLRPAVVEQLLSACRSIKAKRLFLYLAEKANHAWLPLVDKGSVDLGAGDRSFAKGGVYVAKYHLVVPEEIARR